MRIAGLLLCCCAAILAPGCSGQNAATPVASATTASRAAALEPKIVVQLGHQSPVLAVRWVDGGRHLASLALDGSIVIWNVASGAILDHAQVPLASRLLLPDDQQTPPLRFYAFNEGPAADTLAVVYVGANEGDAKRSCPDAHHAGTSWCTYSIDLATRVVRADAGLPIPTGVAHWPLSPDGRLRPEPNHGNGRRGLPDTSDDHYFPVDQTCTSIQRCRYGVTLFAHDASAARKPDSVAELVGHQSPVLAVRWNSTGRYLTSLAEDGSIVSWDVRQQMLSEYTQVPLDPRLLLPEGENKPQLRLHAFTEGSDGRLLVAYAADDNEVAQRACPGANKPGTSLCTYVIENWPFAVRADAGLSIPAGEPPRWPISPDARLRLEPNRGSGPQGLPNTSGERFGKLCTTVQPCRYGVSVFAIGDSTVSRALVGDPRSYFIDADLSPDGLRLVRVEGLASDTRARVDTLDLASGSGGVSFTPERAYHHARWLDATRYLLGSEGYNATNDTDAAMAGFPPALLVEPICAARGDCPAIESRWQMRTADGGGLVALGSLTDSCFRGRSGGVFCIATGDSANDGNQTFDAPPTGLVFLAAGAKDWQPIALAGLAGEVITAIETSPDHRQLAVATRTWDRADAPEAKQIVRLWLLDLEEGTATSPRQLVEIIDPLAGAGRFTDDATIRALSFSADARRIIFTHAPSARSSHTGAQSDADLYLVDTDAAARVRKIPGFARRAVAIGDDRVLGLDDGALLDLDSGRIIANVSRSAPLMRAGWIERSRLLWATTDDGAIHFSDAGDGSPQLTLYTFPDNRYFAVAPGGRYDTNLAADTPMLRWVVPDAPWRSLASQTFMRDYYEPGLYRRLLDCRAGNTCADAFKPLASIASLNRVLPDVRITGVRAGRDAAEAVVAIEVREGVDADAPNGRTRSGIYNPRLFRNGRLVAMTPRQVDAVGIDIAQWRTRNAVPAANGVHHLEFTVPLPTQAGEGSQVFSAYAFNEDRIKGETTTLAWTRPPVAPRPRRAYVLAIGIDDYDTPRFRLHYAVADARLMAAQLSTIPGYETHTLVLAGERDANGGRRRVGRATLARVLSLLAGDGDRSATLAALRADGVEAGMLQPATPDDAVIVSYSGHGWANPRGDFYLIPGDGRWPDGAESPDLSTLFATSDLVAPFQRMQAAEIALVIDACHSAASVADGRFKPGPMGDSGLGQLAYDKGIRILAATQADDVALEDAKLGQGLLTYALAVDGLGAHEADLDGDGTIRVDEWLAYAVRRLPTLANDARVGRIASATAGTRAITFHDLSAGAAARRVQQPALFDFNPRQSPLLLRREAR